MNRPERSATIDPSRLAADLREGNRAALARAITLIESRRSDHQAAARNLVQELLPETGKAMRVGITGSPGVGKSTTIDALGMLPDRRRAARSRCSRSIRPRPAPAARSSATRRAWRGCRRSDDAFIRPSPAAGTLGGVAAKTREAMLLCEAAGFDVVLVETVGIGQSETAVCDMTDFFLALMLPGAGDELQGIKKGLVELADMIAVNKADGDNIARANAAAAEYRAALHILSPRSRALAPAGRDLFGADRRRHRRPLAEGARSSHRHAGVRRFRRATPRAAGQMDVVDAGGALALAAARRRRDSCESAGAGARGRRRPHRAGRRCRRDCTTG